MTETTLSNANSIDRRVGERIRRRRVLLGVTQDQLADALGISYQQIQKYETGANRVSAGRLAQIAEVLEVQPGWFFGSPDTVAEPSDSSRAVIELVRNFSRIEDERVRGHLMALVRSLAGMPGETEEAPQLQNGAAAHAARANGSGESKAS